MRLKFKEQSVSFIVSLVVFGVTTMLGADTKTATFFTVLIGFLFYSLWSLADIINDYEKWHEKIDNDLITLSGRVANIEQTNNKDDSGITLNFNGLNFGNPDQDHSHE